MLTEIAPAKINLYLHVGGVRADGLHDLASLFVFARDGDVLTAEPADDLSLSITGPFAEALAPFPIEDNLILQAAYALRTAAGVSNGAALRLYKNLPVAAGIGGGSADAAAALRLLMRVWDITIPQHALEKIAFDLGADVPACLSQQPILVSGAGEIIEPGPALPDLWICLVNPGVATPTGPIFKAYDTQHPSPPLPQHMPALHTPRFDDACAVLARTRNDLEGPAIALVPEVSAVQDFLNTRAGCRLARMSGSGATCFGIFADEAASRNAANAAHDQGWWSMATQLSQ